MHPSVGLLFDVLGTAITPPKILRLLESQPRDRQTVRRERDAVVYTRGRIAAIIIIARDSRGRLDCLWNSHTAQLQFLCFDYLTANFRPSKRSMHVMWTQSTFMRNCGRLCFRATLTRNVSYHTKSFSTTVLLYTFSRQVLSVEQYE